MGLLLLLVGLFALTLGGLKLRTRVVSVYGRSPLTVVEAAVGAIVLVGSGVGLARIRPVAWTLVVLALGLSLASSWIHILTVSRDGREREASEGMRFDAYLRAQGGTELKTPNKESD